MDRIFGSHRPDRDSTSCLWSIMNARVRELLRDAPAANSSV